MTTQVRPLAGGAWNGVSLTLNKVSKKDTVFGISLNSAQTGAALRAMNQWINCAGLGNGAALAQKTAKAVSLQLQEV